ncbi:ADP-heptose--LPS heptosyltransferase I [Actinobacillus seminis]|uniref:ADP-heptose--LPS heptosyltransferase I n=1 Tax=Actinobacillus seminis TaxID=722 RepID=A0A263HAN8_9PAST|nr:glycosyltransferase family 9 protein [Actinobacillus seminis]OZN24524.1 ADP-heptose--LPS heptosyltransferase I [Actinobacillus seminis]SUU38567.1 glycosyl transferase family protein [Actinobacillus seminis]
MPLFTQPPKSLCILRLSAIGDTCHVLAAVQQIQRHWQQTRITWIIGKTEAALFRHVKGIHFVIYDKKSGWKGVLALWKQLKDCHFDALLNMQTAFRASLLSLGIKANYKIGFGKQRAREGQWLFTNRRIEDPATPHVLDGFLAFVAYLGVPVSPPTWDLGITDEMRRQVTPYLDPNRRNLLISPCSSKAEKDWLPQRYAAIANYANQRHMHVILCGSPAAREMAMVQDIVAHCDFTPTNLCGKTSLLELSALIGLVDLVVAPDSGPAHIATTQGTPIVGLYAYHNPLRTGPYYNLDNIVSVYEQNVQKEFGKPSAQLPWATKLKGKNLMAEIQVEEVITSIEKIENPKG